MKRTEIVAVAFSVVASLMLAGCKSNVTSDGEELPIMAWYSIPPEEATLERYQELADCGFNISFSHIYKIEDLKKALDFGEQTGVKTMATCMELITATDSTVALIKDHPSLYGYFLRDEPVVKDFPALADWASRLRAADGGEHILYLNLLPNYVDTAALGCSYREYVHRFIEEVKLPLVSFDFYPVTTEGVRQNWYENLMDIAEESSAAGLPFWGFALATAHDPYPIPTMASLRLQMYTNLAYGASGLQYFTYWNPGGTTWNFHEAPINQDKVKSEAYDLVKALNKELQARAGVFVGSKVVSVAHTGAVLPPRCPALTELPPHVASLSTGDEGAVVSLLEKGGEYFLVVVNRSLDKPVDLSISFSCKCSTVDREGYAEKVKPGRTEFTIEPGDVEIFRYRK